MSHPVHGKCHKYRMLEKSIFAKAPKAPKEPKHAKTQLEKELDAMARARKKKFGY